MELCFMLPPPHHDHHPLKHTHADVASRWLKQLADLMLPSVATESKRLCKVFLNAAETNASQGWISSPVVARFFALIHNL